MKKSVIFFGLAIMAQQTVVGQLTVLYTNAPDGATVTLSQDISVTNSPADTAAAAGIAFDNGSGSGELAGSGDFSVHNIASANDGGSRALYGINARSLSITQYTGNITVVNDRGLFNSSGFATIDALTYGIYGNVTGNVDRITVTATGGSATTAASNYYAFANVKAYGVYGDVTGDVTGTNSATATGGNAMASKEGGGRPQVAYADARAYGVYGNVDGLVSGCIVATAMGGNAMSSNSQAIASAYACGVFGSVDGNVDGSIITVATGGSARSFSSIFPNAEARADVGAYGVYGDVGGNVDGSIVATATGGSASSIYGELQFRASASANAYGVFGVVGGGVDGSIVATATGGSASSSDQRAFVNVNACGVYGDVTGGVGGSIVATAFGGTSHSAGDTHSVADASGVYGDVTGDVSGTISATATGGSVSSTDFNSRAFAEAFAQGVNGDVTGDVSGTINATATGGRVSSSNSPDTGSAGGLASGVYGDVTGDVSGTISATAFGGTSHSASDAFGGNAFGGAHGIGGFENNNTVLISNFTGNIYASATAGLEIEAGVTNVGWAGAYGIEADDTLYLNATTGSIHAVIAAPDGYDFSDLADRSVAIAIHGGVGDDTVLLSNMDIVGDIDLRAGTNRFEVLGDTRIEGNILATDGFNDFQIISGLLTPVGNVRASNLAGGQLVISGSGGLGFELYEDEADPLNPKLIVEGAVVAESGASIAAWAAAGQTATNMFGNNYEVITATDGIDGTFVENVDSLFILDIDVGDTNVVITLLSELQTQDGENTPAGCSVAQMAVASANAVMNDLSRHASAVRSGQREEVSPAGAQGPDVAQRRRLESGEWIAYLRQINYLGSQDSDGGIAGYDWNSHGFMLGLEKLVGEGLIVGAEGGGLWADLDGKSGAGGGGSDMIIGSLYGSLFSESWYAEGGLTYAHAGNDADRIATDAQRYTGEFDSDLFGGWLEGGYTFAKGSNKLVPYARTTYLHGEHDGYTDSGGTNPMTVDSTTTDNWLTELGVRGIHEWTLENDALVRLALKAGWRQEWLDNNVTADGQILGVNVPFESPEADSSALVLGAKADWQITGALILGIEYEPVISGNWYYHNISGELSIKF